MDVAIGMGFIAGVATIVAIILMGGGLGMFDDIHAVIIIIGGGGLAGAMIRFPLSTMIHGFPMGLRYAFALRKFHPRELVDQITEVADIVRKNGPIAREKMEIDDPFLAQGARLTQSALFGPFERMRRVRRSAFRIRIFQESLAPLARFVVLAAVGDSPRALSAAAMLPSASCTPPSPSTFMRGAAAPGCFAAISRKSTQTTPCGTL